MVKPPVELQRALEGLGLPQREASVHEELAFNTLEAFSRLTRAFRQLPSALLSLQNQRPHEVRLSLSLSLCFSLCVFLFVLLLHIC